MRGRNQREKIAVRGKEVFVGIDVHKESWQVTARVGGEELFHGRMASEYGILRKVLERFEGGTIRVAYEAGPCGFGLHDQLREDGVEVIVVPPSLIPVESGNKVKTDKRDSRKLARLLEGNLLKRVYVLSEEDRADRELLRTCLVEASWILIQKDRGLRKKYDRLKHWKGAKRAIIAMARHLNIRVRRILLNQEPYVLGAAA
jgi:transposase